MKTIIIASVCLLGSLLTYAQEVKKTVEVKFNIEEVKSSEGHWMIAIYKDEASFLSPKPFKAKREKVSLGTEVSFQLPQGEYAVALFQDLNDNAQLEKGKYGIPTEPYSFSGKNVFPLQAKPTFERCKFIVKEGNEKVNLVLQQ